MAMPVPKPATYADIEALPEHIVGEIIGGVLYTQPRPRVSHASAASALTAKLFPPFRWGEGGPGGWILLFEPELHLGADVLVPDIAGWRRARMPEMPLTASIELAPDWLCEILSPSTAAKDRGPKLRRYAAVGVRHVWFLDADSQTVELLRLDGSGYRIIDVFSGDAVVRAEPFEAIELDLSRLWQR